MLNFRHWIAVFGQVFKRNTKSTVEGLRKHFGKPEGRRHVKLSYAFLTYNQTPKHQYQRKETILLHVIT